MQQKTPQPLVSASVDTRKRHQLRVWLVIAGQQDKRDLALPAGVDQLLDTIRPIGAATEQAHDNKLRLTDDFLTVEVDGGVV